jgi:hypothetical protein
MLLRHKTTSEFWEFVYEANSSDGKALVVLRNAAGDQRAVLKTSLPPEKDSEYLVENSGADISASEAMKETLQVIRHTSAIRFVAMPVYFATSGALANAWIEYKRQPLGNWDLIAIAGLLIAVVFVVFDIVLSRNLIRLWRAVQAQSKAAPWNMVWAHRGDSGKVDPFLWTVRFFLFLPYAGGVAYWTLQVCSSTPWVAAVVGALLLLFAFFVWFKA